MYRNSLQNNPKHLRSFGFLFFLLIFSGYFFRDYILKDSASILIENFNFWEIGLIPILTIALSYILIHWFGNLLLLNKNERSVFLFIFPSSLFTFAYLGSWSTQGFLTGSSAINFAIFLFLSLLFLNLLLNTKGDKKSPSLMLAISLIIGTLAFIPIGEQFLMPKVLFFLPTILLLTLQLKSFSWRNNFALLLGLVLTPLFLYPYLFYTNRSIEGFIQVWWQDFSNFPSIWELNSLKIGTMFLIMGFSLLNYSVNATKFTINQRTYLSSINSLMTFSLLYLLFLEHSNIFMLSIFAISSSLMFSRTLMSLRKKTYRFVFGLYILLIILNLFI